MKNKQMRKYSCLITCILTVLFFSAFSQTPSKEKGVFKEYKSGFYQNNILKSINTVDVNKRQQSPPKYFAFDFKGKEYPTDIEKYKKYWHNNPLSQGRAGTCWCFATTSFFETEIFRTTGKKIKISEMFTVYWEYVERAKAFVENRGDVYFAEGSEAVSVVRIMKLYGVVPSKVYSGLKPGQEFHNHKEMFNEMNQYLVSIKKNNNWNEAEVIKTIKSILNYYMGIPPEEFEFEGEKYTHQTFLKNQLKLKPDNYFSFMSTMEIAYNQKGELVEDDNWWHCDDYYNVSLNDFSNIIINSLKKGYTISICGDVSEPGYDRYAEVGIIPDFDIPLEYINENSRQFRLSNKTTTDDHCLHIVGYYEMDNKFWFLVKDSGSGGFDGEHKGYRFWSEDYIKLKMMNILVHKDGASEILNKIIK